MVLTINSPTVRRKRLVVKKKEPPAQSLSKTVVASVPMVKQLTLWKDPVELGVLYDIFAEKDGEVIPVGNGVCERGYSQANAQIVFYGKWASGELKKRYGADFYYGGQSTVIRLPKEFDPDEVLRFGTKSTWRVYIQEARTKEGVPIPKYHGIPRPSVGMDFELFPYSWETKKFVPAWQFLPYEGVKGSGLTLFADGFATEQTPEYTESCLGILCGSIGAELHAFNNKYGKEYFRLTTPVVDVQEFLADAPPSAVELGCMPSRNAYGDASPTLWGGAVPKRTAGTHFHWGFGPEANSSNNYLSASLLPGMQSISRVADHLAMCADVTAGVIITLLLDGLEDPWRRQLYGRAGEYRMPSPTRIELRSMSSRVLQYPQLYYLTGDLMRYGLYLGMFGVDVSPMAQISKIRYGINALDMKALREVVGEYQDWYAGVMEEIYRASLNHTLASTQSRIFIKNLLSEQQYGKWLFGVGVPEINTIPYRAQTYLPDPEWEHDPLQNWKHITNTYTAEQDRSMFRTVLAGLREGKITAKGSGV